MKRASLEFTDFLLTDILKVTLNEKRGIVSVIKNPLPKDVKVIRCGHTDIGTIKILLESESFEDIKEGNKYPELDCPHVRWEAVSDKEGE